MPRRWRFLNFRSEFGRNLIRDWIDGLPNGTRQRVKARLNALVTELELKETLDRPYVGQLRGAPCKGLYELIMKIDKTEFRVLGCYGPKPDEFTLLLGTSEKGNKFTNENACDTAQDRGRSIHDSRRVCEHSLD